MIRTKLIKVFSKILAEQEKQDRQQQFQSAAERFILTHPRASPVYFGRQRAGSEDRKSDFLHETN